MYTADWAANWFNKYSHILIGIALATLMTISFRVSRIGFTLIYMVFIVCYTHLGLHLQAVVCLKFVWVTTSTWDSGGVTCMYSSAPGDVHKYFVWQYLSASKVKWGSSVNLLVVLFCSFSLGLFFFLPDILAPWLCATWTEGLFDNKEVAQLGHCVVGWMFRTEWDIWERYLW